MYTAQGELICRGHQCIRKNAGILPKILGLWTGVRFKTEEAVSTNLAKVSHPVEHREQIGPGVWTPGRRQSRFSNHLHGRITEVSQNGDAIVLKLLSPWKGRSSELLGEEAKHSVKVSLGWR